MRSDHTNDLRNVDTRRRYFLCLYTKGMHVFKLQHNLHKTYFLTWRV